MRSYHGDRTFDGLSVTVGGQPLDPRFDLKTFSKNGFEWSFEGDEPRQLALAIIADATDDGTALRLHEPFMRAVVANFDNEWEMTEDEVRDALRALDDGLNN